METDELQAQLSQLQQLIADEEQKRQRQKVPVLIHTFLFSLVAILLSGGSRNLAKERKSIYIVPFVLRKRSDMDHTVLPANYTMPAFPL